MEPYKLALRSHKKLKKWLESEITIPTKKNNILMGLIGSIISQQLSVIVARVLNQRFRDLYPKTPTAQMVLDTPVETLRSIGLSQQKAHYIHNVAAFMLEHKITAAKLKKMSDDEAIDLLSQIKGVGRWTVEMLLIFTLGREDVFALDDLGIQKAMIEIFKLEGLNKKQLREKMLELSRPWSPYRTYVCLHFWKYNPNT